MYKGASAWCGNQPSRTSGRRSSFRSSSTANKSTAILWVWSSEEGEEEEEGEMRRGRRRGRGGDVRAIANVIYLRLALFGVAD